MPYLFLAGRILYGGMLLVSGTEHFRHNRILTVHAGSKGVPAPYLSVFVSGLLVVSGSLSILTGVRPTWGVIFLTLFLLPTSFIIHNYWADANPAARAANFENFKKNLALLGAAWMFLLIPEPWPFSVEW